MKKIILFCCFIGTALTYACDSENASDKTTALPAPELLLPENITPESFVLRWKAVDHAVLYAYRVYDFSTDSEPIVYQNTTTTQASVTGLRPETQYSIGVKAIGDGHSWGDSAWCSTNVETSPRETPDFTFKVTELKPDSFYVTVYPETTGITYYAGWMERAEWTSYLASDGTLNTETFQEAVRSRLEKEAEEEGLSYLQYLGRNTYESGNGKRMFHVAWVEPGTSCVFYLFGCDRWNEYTFSDKVYFIEVTTPNQL